MHLAYAENAFLSPTFPASTQAQTQPQPQPQHPSITRDPLSQLSALDTSSLAQAVQARLRDDPTAQLQLRSLAVAITALADEPQEQGGAVGAVLSNGDLFASIMDYAIDPTEHSAAEMVRLGEVTRQWRQLSGGLTSLWLRALGTYAPLGLVDGGTLAMRWPGGPRAFFTDYMRAQKGEATPEERFPLPDLVLGMDVYDQANKKSILTVAGTVDVWTQDKNTVISMRPGAGDKLLGSVFDTPAYCLDEYAVRVTLVRKGVGRMAVLLDKAKVSFTEVEDRTPEGAAMLLVSSLWSQPLFAPKSSSPAVKVTLQFRLRTLERRRRPASASGWACREGED